MWLKKCFEENLKVISAFMIFLREQDPLLLPVFVFTESMVAQPSYFSALAMSGIVFSLLSAAIAYWWMD